MMRCTRFYSIKYNTSELSDELSPSLMRNSKKQQQQHNKAHTHTHSHTHTHTHTHTPTPTHTPTQVLQFISDTHTHTLTHTVQSSKRGTAHIINHGSAMTS